MIVSTAAKALLLREPKYNDSSGRRDRWAVSRDRMDKGGPRGGGERELAKVSFSDICGQRT